MPTVSAIRIALLRAVNVAGHNPFPCLSFVIYSLLTPSPLE
jgi:hypothetical protein